MSPAMEPIDTTMGYNPSMMAAQGPWTGVPGAFGIPGYATYGAAPGFAAAAPFTATQMPTPAPMGAGMAPCPMGGPMAGPMFGPMGLQAFLNVGGPSGMVSAGELQGNLRIPGFNFNVSRPFMQGNLRWPGMQASLFWPGMQGAAGMPGWQWQYGMGPGATGGPAADPAVIDP